MSPWAARAARRRGRSGGAWLGGAGRGCRLEARVVRLEGRSKGATRDRTQKQNPDLALERQTSTESPRKSLAFSPSAPWTRPSSTSSTSSQSKPTRAEHQAPAQLSSAQRSAAQLLSAALVGSRQKHATQGAGPSIPFFSAPLLPPGRGDARKGCAAAGGEEDEHAMVATSTGRDGVRRGAGAARRARIGPCSVQRGWPNCQAQQSRGARLCAGGRLRSVADAQGNFGNRRTATPLGCRHMPRRPLTCARQEDREGKKNKEGEAGSPCKPLPGPGPCLISPLRPARTSPTQAGRTQGQRHHGLHGLVLRRVGILGFVLQECKDSLSGARVRSACCFSRALLCTPTRTTTTFSKKRKKTLPRPTHEKSQQRGQNHSSAHAQGGPRRSVPANLPPE